MAYKAVLAALMSSTVLVGCGSGSDSESLGSASEYNLSDYEGRSVSSDTLAGTWVAVSSGYSELTHSQGTTKTNLSGKEYFVITKEGNDYHKASCGYDTTNKITLDGGSLEVKAEKFVGTVTDNKTITGKIEFDINDIEDNETGSVLQNIEIVKISDEIGSLAMVTVNVNSVNDETAISCYQKSNSTFTFGSLSGKSEEIKTPLVDINRLNGGGDDSELSYTNWPSVDLDFESYKGHSVSFDVNVDSSLSETVNFTASNGSDSVTGTIVVQLPVQ